MQIRQEGRAQLPIEVTRLIVGELVHMPKRSPTGAVHKALKLAEALGLRAKRRSQHESAIDGLRLASSMLDGLVREASCRTGAPHERTQRLLERSLAYLQTHVDDPKAHCEVRHALRAWRAYRGKLSLRPAAALPRSARTSALLRTLARELPPRAQLELDTREAAWWQGAAAPDVACAERRRTMALGRKLVETFVACEGLHTLIIGAWLVPSIGRVVPARLPTQLTELDLELPRFGDDAPTRHLLQFVAHQPQLLTLRLSFAAKTILAFNARRTNFEEALGALLGRLESPALRALYISLGAVSAEEYFFQPHRNVLRVEGMRVPNLRLLNFAVSDFDFFGDDNYIAINEPPARDGLSYIGWRMGMRTYPSSRFSGRLRHITLALAPWPPKLDQLELSFVPHPARCTQLVPCDEWVMVAWRGGAAMGAWADSLFERHRELIDRAKPAHVSALRQRAARDNLSRMLLVDGSQSGRSMRLTLPPDGQMQRLSFAWHQHSTHNDHLVL